MADAQEPWDVQAFIRFFNEKAKRSGVMPVDGDVDEAELRARYEGGAWRHWPTVREFAEAEVLFYSRD